MIVANMATYPQRRSGLEAAVHALLPQVDRLNLVLNEYNTPPDELKGIDGLNCIIPKEDTKDVGKFYPDVADAEWVLFVDDDIIYPADYVKLTVERARKLESRCILGGYHTSIYRRPRLRLEIESLRRCSIYWLRWWKVANLREVTSFRDHVAETFFVDQIGTGAAIMAGHLMPPYGFMRTSQKFVDVRLALWCFEKGILPVALPREANWLSTEDDEQSIFRTFTTRHHRHVAKEIWRFAFKRRYIGEKFDMNNRYLPTQEEAGMA